jgi:hypothetical protein
MSAAGGVGPRSAGGNVRCAGYGLCKALPCGGWSGGPAGAAARAMGPCLPIGARQIASTGNHELVHHPSSRDRAAVVAIQTSASNHKIVLHTFRHRETAQRSWRSRQVRIFWIASRPRALAMTEHAPCEYCCLSA